MCKQTKMESLRGRIRIFTGEEISPLLKRSVVVVGEDDLTGSEKQIVSLSPSNVHIKGPEILV